MKKIIVSVCCVTVLLLGLFLMGKKKRSGVKNPMELQGSDDKALVMIGGQPLMTLKSFEKEYQKIIAQNSQLKQMAQFVSDFKLKLLNQLVDQKVIAIFINQAKIASSDKYKEELSRIGSEINKVLDKKYPDKNIDKLGSKRAAEYELLMSQAIRMLNMKYFAQQFFSPITDSEIRSFYEENKDKIPGLSVSSVDREAVGKEGKQYRPLEDVKDTLKLYLENIKKGKVLEQRIAELRKKYNVVIDEKVAATLKSKPRSQEEIKTLLEILKSQRQGKPSSVNSLDASVAKAAQA